MNDRPIRSVRLIAKRLGVSESTARRYIAKGILPAHKINGRTSPFIVRQADIDRLTRPESKED